MMDKVKEEGAINLSTAGKDSETNGPTITTNGDISRTNSAEHENLSQVIIMLTLPHFSCSTRVNNPCITLVALWTSLNL